MSVAYVLSAGPSRVVTFHSDADVLVKAKEGQVFAAFATNENAAVRYLQLFNKATAPAAADVPVFSFPILATSSLLIGTEFFTEHGSYFDTGIAIGISTAKASYTAATAAEHMHFVQFA
jgi:hypothetical protein